VTGIVAGFGVYEAYKHVINPRVIAARLRGAVRRDDLTSAAVPTGADERDDSDACDPPTPSAATSAH
jgi:hypothetical protein